MSWEHDQERYNTGLSDEVLVINMLAEKYGYPRAEIKEVVQSPMAFIYDTMKLIPKDYDEAYPIFHITKFGKFIPKWRYLNKDKDDDKTI